MVHDREVVEALMDMVNQHCQDPRDPDVVLDGALSSNEDALFLLVEMGYAKDLGRGRYRLLWEKLKPYRTVRKES